MERARRFARRHATALLAIVVSTAFTAAALTDGTWDLAAPDSAFSTYYDALGDSLTHGRFDVPAESIGSEAFLLDGRTYGYFGPTPALLRLPLNALFPRMRGRWTRPMLLAGFFFTLVATYLVALQARRGARRLDPTPGRGEQLATAALLVCAGVGTSLFFLARAPILYHEASCTAVAFAMWSYLGLLRYRYDHKARHLYLAIACALLAFQARGSVGGGPVIAVGLVFATTPRASWATARTSVAAVVFAACTGAVLYKNHRIFHDLTGAPPMSRHIQLINDPARVARTGGRLLQPANLRTTVSNYFGPRNLAFHPPFPYVYLRSRHDATRLPEARIDYVEEYASLTGVNTFWCVLALVGLAAIVTRRGSPERDFQPFRIPLVGAVAGGSVMLVTSCITERYLHDLYPALALAGTVGAATILRDHRRSALVPLLVVVGLYTCYANVSISVTSNHW